MISKKSKVWTFLFSLLPGAGEMYMGFMKQGASMMGMFFALIAVAAYFNIGPIIVFLPVIWCYSFFNVHNIYSLSDEEFYALEDDYVFHLERILPMEKLEGRRGRILAVILILTGLCILWNYVSGFVNSLVWYLFPDGVADNISGFVNHIPQIVVALILIVAGIKMIKGKKVELEIEEKEV